MERNLTMYLTLIEMLKWIKAFLQWDETQHTRLYLKICSLFPQLLHDRHKLLPDNMILITSLGSFVFS